MSGGFLGGDFMFKRNFQNLILQDINWQSKEARKKFYNWALCNEVVIIIYTNTIRGLGWGVLYD
jgi:hypothetical protein